MSYRKVIFLFSFVAAAWAQATPDFAAVAQQASAARESNNIPQAIALYQQGTALNPKWEEGWWWLGSLAYDSNRYPEAIAALRHAVELNPKNAPGFGLLGLCEWETGAHGDALRDIEESLKLGLPGQEQMEGVLRFHEGLALTEADRFDDALRAYAWFVQRNVHHETLLTALGAAALHQRTLPDAMSREQKEVALAAGNASFLSMSGSGAEAVSAFKALAQQWATTPNVHYLYGSMLVATAPDSAIQELQREIEVAPKNGPAYALLSYLLMQDGDMAQAIPNARNAEAYDPGSPLTHYVQGRALVETGNLQQGIRYLETAVGAAPANLMNHIALASAYAKAGMPVKARAERDRAESLARNSGELAQR